MALHSLVLKVHSPGRSWGSDCKRTRHLGKDWPEPHHWQNETSHSNTPARRHPTIWPSSFIHRRRVWRLEPNLATLQHSVKSPLTKPWHRNKALQGWENQTFVEWRILAWQRLEDICASRQGCASTIWVKQSVTMSPGLEPDTRLGIRHI